MGWGYGNIGSGSNVLNFKILGGTSQPLNPKENTIWVNTEAEITEYFFGIEPPEDPVPGTVWIKTGTNSTVAFNVVKKNAIMVYPLNCKQYIDGTWENVTAKSYINNNWVDWYNGQIYENGEEFEDITGGISLGTQTYSLAEKKADHILLAASASTNVSYSHATCYANNLIDLTNYSELTVVANTERYENLSGFVKIGITKNRNQFYEPTEYRVGEILGVQNSNVGDIILTYDISSVSGSYYVGVANKANVTKIYSIYLK